MLISNNVRETQVLKLAFEQRNIKVIHATPDYKNFVKILQYRPDIALLELPGVAHRQLHFVELLKGHKKTKHIPIVSYGDSIDEAMKKGLKDKGIFYYVERPLKCALLFDIMVKHLRPLKKDFGLLQNKASDKEQDIEALLSKETLPVKKIELMTGYVDKLMAFPFTVAKVLQLADSAKSAASDLAKVLQADPVISAQLLKISNSVIFASLNRRIGSVKDAIIRVGFRETKRLVMSMSVMKLFGTTDKNIGFDRTAFWHHSLVCGIISERLARQISLIDTEEAFLAGILHDFGILLLDEFFPTIFSRALEATAEKNGRFIQCEQSLLGVTHNDIVAELFTKWKLPESVIEGVVGQYRFREFEKNTDTPAKKIALCVGLSDIIAKTAGFGRECDQFISPVANWVFDLVKLPSGFTGHFLEDIAGQMALYREFLKLDKIGLPGDRSDEPSDGKERVGIINHTRDVFIPPLVYLQNEGYGVVPISTDLGTGAVGNDVHSVVVWSDTDTTVESIQKDLQSIKVPNGAAEASGAAIVFVDENAALLGRRGELTNATFVSKSFDLRLIDTYAMGTYKAVSEPAEAVAGVHTSYR